MITTDIWNGLDHADTLATIAPRLPALQHRVIIDGNHDNDVIYFHDYFVNNRASVAGRAHSDPDAVAQILFTSGTTGEPKAALRTADPVTQS